MVDVNVTRKIVSFGQVSVVYHVQLVGLCLVRIENSRRLVFILIFLPIETKCIGYYGTKMTWSNAAMTCRDMQGDLISLRDDSILPLIYQVTADSHRRKKREIAADKTVAWTSARAIQLNNCKLIFLFHTSCTKLKTNIINDYCFLSSGFI